MRVMATITMKVWYDDSTSTKDVEQFLRSNIETAIAHGLLSDPEHTEIVDTWDLEVETKEVRE